MRPFVFALVALFAVPCFAAEKIKQASIQRRGLFGRRDVQVDITKIKGGNANAQLNAALKAQAQLNRAQAEALRQALKAQALRQQFRAAYVPQALLSVHYAPAQQLNAGCSQQLNAGYSQQLNAGCNLLSH